MSDTRQQHPFVRGAHTSNSILVNARQRGNPVLNSIRGVPWEFADIVPDYQMGLSTCALFLSLRYHRLHPEYIHTRISKLANMYTLRILMIQCDVADHQSAIRELTKVALINRLTMIVASSPEECGQYLETYKAYEHRPPDTIRTRMADDYSGQLSAALTSVRGVNKTDVMTLSTRLGSFANIVDTPTDTLTLLPGMGEQKARRLVDTFRQPFRSGESAPEVAQAPEPEAPEPEAPEPEAQPDDQNTPVPGLPDNFESLPEEEQLRIALELSVDTD